MVDCKKCYHYEACKSCYELAGYKMGENIKLSHCPIFKDKDLIAELPCELGGYVFEISGDEIYRMQVKHITLYRFDAEIECVGTELEEFKDDFEDGELEDYENQVAFYTRDFGETVFFTREEAEAVLEERENNDG